MRLASPSRGERRLAGAHQDHVALRRVDPSAEDVAVMPLQRIVPGKPGIARRRDRLLHGGDGVLGHQVFDQAAFRGRQTPFGRRAEQDPVLQQQRIDAADQLLESRQGRQRGAEVGGLAIDEPLHELEGLHVTHDYREALNRAGFDYPIVSHPIVRTHRETGQKVLWVNFTQRPTILGLDRAESRELLETILRQYKKPELQVRFSWRPGSIAFWDNRAAVHYAVRNYGDYPRLLERILIADEPQWANL